MGNFAENLNLGNRFWPPPPEFLHIFVDLLQEAHFPKGVRLKSFQYEMRAIFTESLVHNALFNTVVYGSNETHIIMHNLKGKIGINWNFGNKLFLFISFDSYHKKLLLEMNIPLTHRFEM